MSKVSCSYCGKFHLRTEAKSCPKRLEAIRQTRNSRSDTKIYNSYRWKKLRAEKVESTMHLCEICHKLFNKDGKQRLNTAEAVHHIVPINRHRALGKSIEDLAYDFNNLVSLCKHHHEEAHSKKLESKEAIEKYYGIELSNDTDYVVCI